MTKAKRPKAAEVTSAQIDHARLAVARALRFADLMGREFKCENDSIRLVLYGIVALQAENRALRLKLKDAHPAGVRD